MTFVTFRSGDAWRPGLLLPGGVLDVAAAAEADGGTPLPADPSQLLALGPPAWDRMRALAAAATRDGRSLLAEEELTLGPPTPKPGKILCIGLNYRRHAAESGMAEPAEPVLFSKFDNTVVGPDAPVAIGGLTQVDYESELALVIGRTAKNVAEADALDYVGGYLNANDVSERELQMRSGQWLLGKTLDGFLPIGPYLVSADEVGDPGDLPVRGRLNGDTRQDSRTSDLIFSVPEILSYVTRFITLDAGDLICTGTPEGVILGRDPKVWLKPGDVYEVEVGPLGTLRTPFVSDAPT